MSESRFIQWKTSNPESYAEMLRKRRVRYNEDESARLRQLEHNRNWRKKQRDKQQSTPKKRTPKPKFFDVSGAFVEFWSVGRTVEFLGIDKKTIANLEDNGSIPINHYTAPNRRRWWPAEFVYWLKPFFAARKIGISAKEFHRRVWIGWSEEQTRDAVPVIQDDGPREERLYEADQTETQQTA